MITGSAILRIMRSQTKTMDEKKSSDIAMVFKFNFLSYLADFAKIAAANLTKEDLMDVLGAASGYISTYGVAAEIGH